MKKVKITQRAIKDLVKIKAFNTELLGKKQSEKIIEALFNKMEILEREDIELSNVGAIDQDFSHLKYEYRKLIEGYYKITYRVGKSKIYVIRIFDTRQNPNKNK